MCHLSIKFQKIWLSSFYLILVTPKLHTFILAEEQEQHLQLLGQFESMDLCQGQYSTLALTNLPFLVLSCPPVRLDTIIIYLRSI